MFAVFLVSFVMQRFTLSSEFAGSLFLFNVFTKDYKRVVHIYLACVMKCFWNHQFVHVIVHIDFQKSLSF